MVFNRWEIEPWGGGEDPGELADHPFFGEPDPVPRELRQVREPVRDGTLHLFGVADDHPHGQPPERPGREALLRWTTDPQESLSQRQREADQAAGLLARFLSSPLSEQGLDLTPKVCERVPLAGRGRVCLAGHVGELADASLGFDSTGQQVVTLSVAWPAAATGAAAGDYLLAQLAGLDALELTLDGTTETISAQHAVTPNQLRVNAKGRLQTFSVFTLPLGTSASLPDRLRSLVIQQYPYAEGLRPPDDSSTLETFSSADFRAVVAEHLPHELRRTWQMSEFPEVTPNRSKALALELVRTAQVLSDILRDLRQTIDTASELDLELYLGGTRERNLAKLGELKEYLRDPNALQHAFLSFLHSYARSGVTTVHVNRVADIARSSAQDQGFPPFMVALTVLQALCHDAGKADVLSIEIALEEAGLLDPTGQTPGTYRDGMAFVERFFNTPGSTPTDAEYKIIQKHSGFGRRVLAKTGLPELATEMASKHHADYAEDPKAGLVAGTVSFADAMAAMLLRAGDKMSGRSSARPFFDALLDAILCSGSQFDPRVVRPFLVRYGECLTRRPHAEFFLGARKSKAFFNQPGGVPELLQNLLAAMEQVWPDQRLSDDLLGELYSDLRQALIQLVKNQAATNGNLKLKFSKTTQGMEAQIFVLPYQLARGEQATAEHAASLGFTSDQFEIRQYKGVAELWTKARTLHFAPQQAQQVLKQA